MRRRDQPAIPRLLRPLQPRATYGRRQTSAMLVWGPCGRPSRTASRRRPAGRAFRSIDGGHGHQARASSLTSRFGRGRIARLLRDRRLMGSPRGSPMSRHRAAVRWIAGGAMDEAGSWTGAGDAATARVEAMVRDYQVKLARYVRRMTGDAEAALDLTQDVFLSAYRMLKADPERELTGGWLYRAATNGAISFLRRRKIVRMLPLDREVERAAWRIDERGAASIDLQAALKRLPPEQAAAVL